MKPFAWFVTGVIAGGTAVGIMTGTVDGAEATAHAMTGGVIGAIWVILVLLWKGLLATFSKPS